MTSRTTCHHLFSANLVFLFQLETLVRVEIAVLPLHVEDLGLRTDEFLGFAMARETPFHLQRVLLENRRHVVDLSMACRTTDSLCYVDTVIEISELRKVVNAFPF